MHRRHRHVRKTVPPTEMSIAKGFSSAKVKHATVKGNEEVEYVRNTGIKPTIRASSKIYSNIIYGYVT